MDLTRYADLRWKLHNFFISRTGFKPGSDLDQYFLSLALCGEAGELANMMKKRWRGDLLDMTTFQQAEFEVEIDKEIGDIFSYWMNLVLARRLDVEKIILESLEKAAKKAEGRGFQLHHP